VPFHSFFRIIKIESEFYKHVDLNQVSRKVGLDVEVVDFIYRYWILKRRSCGNRPLLLPRYDRGWTRGRCYDQNFRRFSAKKLAFLSKTNVVIKSLHNLALFRVKDANFLTNFSTKIF
jgi:hypothetical protein